MNDILLQVKQCTKCRALKTFGQFYSDTRIKSGLRPECKDCHKAYSKKYRSHNSEQERNRAKVFRELNPEKSKEGFRKYRQANPEKRALWNFKRRANKLGNNHQPYNIDEILNAYGTDCFICKKPIDLEAARQPGRNGWENGLHIDHLVALVNGGSDSLSNVRPTHGKCNLQKGSR